MLKQAQTEIRIATRDPGFLDVTDNVTRWLREIGARDGLATVFIRHTSASLTVQENADRAVQSDLLVALDGLAPRDAPYVHCSEGADDMPAHIKAMLSSTSLQIPVNAGRMVLGTWQAVYLIEHRDGAWQRQLVLHYIGDLSAA